MNSIQVLSEWVIDPRSPREASDSWKGAFKALVTLPPSAPKQLVEQVFDRLLDEAPTQLYRMLSSLDDAHWPVLAQAMSRCADIEAQVLVSASRRGQGALDDAAEFIALLSTATDFLGCIEKTLRTELAHSKAVLAACAEGLGSGWVPLTIPLAGVVTAVAAHGSANEVAVFRKVRPPEEAIAVFKALVSKLAPERAAAVQACIDGRHTVPQPLVTARFKRQHVTSKKPEPSKVTSPVDALHRVYSKPDDDAARAVYADLLLERQQPLGEFIQLQLARQAGRAGTLTKERLIFEEFGAELWPEHPCAVAKVPLSFHEVERGFPAVFPVTAVPSFELQDELRGLPGWKTLRVLHAWDDEVDLATLLPVEMPALEVLERVGMSVLEKLAKVSWPVKRMSLLGTTFDARITGFPKLETLEFIPRATPVFSKMVSRPHLNLGTVVDSLGPTGLLQRIQRLVVRTHFFALGELVAACERLPASLRQFETQAPPNTQVVARRTSQGLELSVQIDGLAADRLLAELGQLDASKVAGVDVVLGGGVLSAQQRSAVEKQARAVLARFTRSSLASRAGA